MSWPISSPEDEVRQAHASRVEHTPFLGIFPQDELGAKGFGCSLLGAAVYAVYFWHWKGVAKVSADSEEGGRSSPAPRP